MPDMLTSRHTFTIEWGDCDPANIVYNPNYFRWFDAALARHFKSAGLPKPELIRRYGIVGFPLVDTHAKFFIPSTHGDEVTIVTRIASFGRSSFEVSHNLMRGDNLAVEGREKRVLVRKNDDGTGITSCPVPEDVKALFTGTKD